MLKITNKQAYTAPQQKVFEMKFSADILSVSNATGGNESFETGDNLDDFFE